SSRRLLPPVPRRFPPRPLRAGKKAKNHALLISLSYAWQLFDINQMPIRLFQRTINSSQGNVHFLGKN
ncbi:MAG: hypothetical protein E6973_14180, partial [Enterobacter hormaechei]|nr:hypothetical protein [Enterobacter hormaechei]